MVSRLCPCCDMPARQATEPLTEDRMAAGYELMRERGWTAKSLLAKRLDDLEWISPDLVAWMQFQAIVEALT